MILAYLLAIIGAFPCEYLIDCGPGPMPGGNSMRIDLIARDGSGLTLPIDVSGDDPKANREFILFALKDNDWIARPGPGSTLVVTGTKKGSPVKLVTIKSEAAWPTVRWVPLPPPAPKPKR